MKMKYYVYIIQSEMDNSYYKGFSLDPHTRLEFHNRGESLYTSRKIPCKLVGLLAFDTKTEALMHVPTKCRKREKIEKIPYNKFGSPNKFKSKFIEASIKLEELGLAG